MHHSFFCQGLMSFFLGAAGWFRRLSTGLPSTRSVGPPGAALSTASGPPADRCRRGRPGRPPACPSPALPFPFSAPPSPPPSTAPAGVLPRSPRRYGPGRPAAGSGRGSRGEPEPCHHESVGGVSRAPRQRGLPRISWPSVLHVGVSDRWTTNIGLGLTPHNHDGGELARKKGGHVAFVLNV